MLPFALLPRRAALLAAAVALAPDRLGAAPPAG